MQMEIKKAFDTTVFDPNQLFRLPNKQLSRTKLNGKIHLVLWNVLNATGKEKYTLPTCQGDQKDNSGKHTQSRNDIPCISIVTDETESERRYILGLVDRLALIFRTIECILVDFSDLDDTMDDLTNKGGPETKAKISTNSISRLAPYR
eukprot:gnl/Chilomastix_caulleri/6269.p1 GENE.gnl/Chilomastix_caulleri/6269~~gnl/Chilomastix_caulleri/6269.p1  ORF type:complete len:148 (-),score=18.55 gnl/Chilomastix_caulleri/6269:166-609(-)